MLLDTSISNNYNATLFTDSAYENAITIYCYYYYLSEIVALINKQKTDILSKRED